MIALDPGGLPRVNEIGIDGRVFGFALVVSVVTGIVFGLAPALRASTPNLTESLKEGDRGSTGSRQRVRGALVITEVALALVLLIGAALMIRSFWRLQDVNPGFDAKNLLTMQMSVTAAPGEGQSVATFFEQLQEKVKGLPGVSSVAVSNGLPFGGANQMPLTIEGRPPPAPGQTSLALMYVASPDYLRTMGIRLVKGRNFTDRDTKTQLPVVLIDEVLARQYFSGEDPLGQRLRLGVPGGEKLPGLEIVGIVENVKDKTLGGKAPASPQFYYNFNQFIETSMPTLALGVQMTHMGDERALSFVIPMFYFMFIILSTLRLDFWLSTFTGFVAGVEFFLMAMFFPAYHGGSYDPWRGLWSSRCSQRRAARRRRAGRCRGRAASPAIRGEHRGGDRARPRHQPVRPARFAAGGRAAAERGCG